MLVAFRFAVVNLIEQYDTKALFTESSSKLIHTCNVTNGLIDKVCILLEVNIIFCSEPDMFIVFILSLLLALPPIIISVYLWTSVARFYNEIRENEEIARAAFSKPSATMLLIGNLMIHEDISIQQPNSNTQLQK